MSFLWKALFQQNLYVKFVRINIWKKQYYIYKTISIIKFKGE